MPLTTSSDASQPDPDALARLADGIGHRFGDPSLLVRAMQHRSWQAENDAPESNERLEFLGDAVLGWVVADVAYSAFADLPEGRLTDLRKSVVNANALAGLARRVNLGPAILLGKGEDAAGGRDKTSILSDAFEAVIGAMYLDAGPMVAYEKVKALLLPEMERALPNIDRLDAKTVLQERAARLGHGAPRYELSSSGPDHAKHFVATVTVGEVSASGEGPSKKVAEQHAAEIALTQLPEPTEG
jgi:ribonuclease III